MTTPIRIRLENPEDAAQVREVVASAFEREDEARLVDRLRGLPGVFGLVAEHGDGIAGHILFSPVRGRDDVPELNGAGLAPLSVHANWQRKGIGTALGHRGVEECRARGFALVVVLGHADYYPRFGFVPARRIGLRCQWSGDDDHFMFLDLRAGQAALANGFIRYLPEFDEA